MKDYEILGYYLTGEQLSDVLQSWLDNGFNSEHEAVKEIRKAICEVAGE